MASGSYAEYTAVDASVAAVVPDSIPLEKAAAALIQGLTALTLIDEAHKVNKGDWVLVPAAAGGTGGWLCQLLKQRGAHTIGAASTPAKRELALSYGAEVVVGYDKILETVKEKTGGKGVVASFDGVGKTTFDTSLEAVARKGTIVSFGNASGPVEPLTLARLSPKCVKVVRPTVFGYIQTREEKNQYMKELWEAIEKGLRIEIHKVYDLSDVQQAHRDLEGRHSTGKLLLKP
jgi:NADPH:quinone reductase